MTARARRQPRAGSKQFELRAGFCQQTAQHHEPALFVQHPGTFFLEPFEDKTSQALKRKDVKPGVTWDGGAVEQLLLQLIGALFGREQNQRRALGRFAERLSSLLQAAKSFSAACRAY